MEEKSGNVMIDELPQPDLFPDVLAASVDQDESRCW